MRTWGYVLAVIILVSGCITAAWLTSRDIPDDLTGIRAAVVPVEVEVTSTSVDFNAPAEITAFRVDGMEMVSPGTQGMATEILVESGDIVGSGTPLFRANGILVRAYSGDVLHRPLATGDRGPDVVAAQRLLGQLLPEVEVPETGRVDRRTVAAISAYAESIGAGSNIKVLDNTWFAVLPAEQLQVESVELTVGAPVPSLGETLVTSPAGVSGVEVTSNSQGPDGAYVFLAEGERIAVARQADLWTADEAAARPVIQTKGVASESGTTLALQGRVVLLEPEIGLSVPGASLVPGDGEASCVVLASIPHEPVGVEVVGGDASGNAQLISPDLQPGTRVLVNPLEIAPDVRCP